MPGMTKAYMEWCAVHGEQGWNNLQRGWNDLTGIPEASDNAQSVSLQVIDLFSTHFHHSFSFLTGYSHYQSPNCIRRL